MRMCPHSFPAEFARLSHAFLYKYYCNNQQTELLDDYYCLHFCGNSIKFSFNKISSNSRKKPTGYWLMLDANTLLFFVM